MKTVRELIQALILNCDLEKLKELIDYKYDRIMGF